MPRRRAPRRRASAERVHVVEAAAEELSSTLQRGERDAGLTVSDAPALPLARTAAAQPTSRLSSDLSFSRFSIFSEGRSRFQHHRMNERLRKIPSHLSLVCVVFLRIQTGRAT
jgi:hypothetical protein